MENEAIQKFNNKLFQVLVPKIALYTPEEIRVYGFNGQSMDSVAKRDNQYDLSNCMIPAVKMLEIYSNGYSIRLVNSSDLNSLYKVLEGYLQYKYNVSNMSIHRVKYDESELRSLDEFINEIFGYNKTSIVKNIIDIKNGFSLGLGFAPDKQLKQSVHLDNAPISKTTESRYGKISEKLIRQQSSNISNSPVIDFSNIKRNSVFD